LFAYRDASRHDQGLESFRVVNWVLAPNHSQIINVWDSLDAFNWHLAQDHSRVMPLLGPLLFKVLPHLIE
jgi:hypothetical protein